MATFPTTIDTFQNPTAANKLNAPSHAGVETLQNDALAAVEAKVGVNGSAVVTSLDYFAATGWKSVSDSWAYASADSPTFVITVPTDATARYVPGMRIQLTQSATVKYFIVTAVTATTLTVYGGTSYVLANSAISAISYSTAKTPFGFTGSPSLWMVRVTDANDRNQATPTATTWYNPGSTSISLPIGVWRTTYQASVYGSKAAATVVDVRATLSTGSSTESDPDLSSYIEIDGASATITNIGTVFREKTITVAAKTPYFLNVKTNTSGLSNIGIVGLTGARTILEATCAYL